MCEVLIRLTGVVKMIWSCPSFSKMAEKSVERGETSNRFQEEVKLKCEVCAKL